MVPFPSINPYLLVNFLNKSIYYPDGLSHIAQGYMDNIRKLDENFRINDFIPELINKGHEVSILTGQPNYPSGKIFSEYTANPYLFSKYKGANIFRLPIISRGSNSFKLLLNYLSFIIVWCLLSPWKLRKFQPDVIFVYEPSPVTVGIPAVYAKTLLKAPVYFWVQDLWPESLKAAGGVKNIFVLSFFNSLTKWIYNNSRKVLIQSNGFREYILNQGIPDDKIIFYPNLTESLYKPVKEVNEYQKFFQITVLDSFY